jgi:SAM-dependent MidA family methyltransferase
MDSPLIQHLRSRIQRDGPITFRDFMEEVLYHPDFGYYTSPRNPIGRAGDFYTSSDLDPVFGKLLARKFQEMAATLGVPEDSFTILELGAGRGLLAREILQHAPFRYCILERSRAMRDRQRDALSELAVEWLTEMPAGLIGCIFSNEFFDALPVHRVVRRNGVLREVYVTGEFTEIEGNLQESLEVPIAEGQLADICIDARRWIERIAASLDRGYHLAIDYGYQDREFYARPRGTLMCYWKHQAVEDPYVRIGEQDITAHVNFSDLMNSGAASGLETVSLLTQMDFLIQMGILQEIEALVPATNVEAIQRVMAIKKLILPDAMGQRFKVLTQRKTGIV